MKKNKSDVARRPWSFLRLALLWARKGGVFKNRLIMDLRLLPKFIKTLKHYSHDHHRGALHYGERELSFDDTPVIHVKMHRPSSLRFKMPNLIPCINTQVDFDYDFDPRDDKDDIYQYYYNEDVVSMKSFLNGPDDDEDDVHGVENDVLYSCRDSVCDQEEINDPPPNCDEGIDLKAEQFIAKFYQQMKLQRQISYLQYTEMINRGAN